MTTDLLAALDGACADFTGVVVVDRMVPGGATERLFEFAGGHADRANRVAVRPDTRLGVASVTKGFTAVTVLSLVGDGLLRLDLRAREVLGADLPLIPGNVTVEHLLTHRSGIGDYVDATGPAVLPVPVQELDGTSAYLRVLEGFAAKRPAGVAFEYCNSAYVVLALLAERVTGRPFADLVAERVFEPAGMGDSGFPRSDALPERAHLGYLDDGRTNVFVLPVVGSGDGGAYSTANDLTRFWDALLGERLLDAELTAAMTRVHVVDTRSRYRYALGLWVWGDRDVLMLDGCDLGVSCRSLCEPTSGRIATVLSNTTDGAWPVAARFEEVVFD